MTVAASLEKKICYYFFVFLNFHFAECFSDTQQRLCRVPDKKHSVKASLPINFLPSALCRVRHSAKPLSSVCQVYFGLCRVPHALDKVPVSSSEPLNFLITVDCMYPKCHILISLRCVWWLISGAKNIQEKKRSWRIHLLCNTNQSAWKVTKSNWKDPRGRKKLCV